MALQGNLHDMTVADLIQHSCQDGKTARILIEHNGRHAGLFFDAGQLVDAELAGQHGEEVVYALLDWKDGTFTLEPDVPAAVHSITRSYAGILLNGSQRLDEAQQQSTDSLISNLNTFKEVTKMAPKKKSEMLAEALAELISSSSDIEGAAVVGTDGLVYSINTPTGKVDETLVGAVAAAALGLSKKSVEQLKRGTFLQSLTQGDKGNILLIGLDPQTLLVELTPPNINLGMAFAETREAAAKLREIL
jgi:predicted regulator of Ras-like GTPase activity (Roadblock/LC7/MglB family)